jgi:transposase
MKRHEVTDEQWELIQPILPKRTATTGRRPSDPRVMLNGILWILRTGSPWRDLPERFGPWQTVYDHFSNWRKKGVYDRILEALHIRLDADGAIDWDLWCIDGSSVRASRAAAGASKKAAGVTRTSRKTTLWAAREADSAASSMWLLTVEACR